MNHKKICWIGLTLLAAACSSRSASEQNLTADAALERGLTAIQNRKWSDAATALERFIFQFPTHPRAQEARFLLGEAHLGRREYLTAIAEFNRLASEFPASPWADDARFKVCESYSRLSPKAPLDQEYTLAGIAHCQSLVAYYPTSDFVERAKEIETDLTNKLADKEYLNADYYYKSGAFDSAIIGYDRIIKEFPATPAAPRSLLRLYQAYSKLGYKEEATAAKDKLLKDYPTSDPARQLTGGTVGKTS